MNIQEIYELGLEQGWDEADAFYLAQLAWAESKGDPYAVKEEDDGTWSLGIWQINSVHILNLIEAGIINVEGIGEEAAFGGDPDAEEYLQWLEAVRTQLADPQVQADAAWFVGPRMDYNEPWEDWDWTRWGSHGLEMTDVNFPGNYGGDISRTVGEEEPELSWDQTPVPDDFKNAVTSMPEWDDRMRGMNLTDSQQDLALKWVYNRFVNGFDEGGYYWDGSGTLDEFLGGLEPDTPENRGDLTALDEVQGLFDSGMFGPPPESPADYIPTSQIGALPEGWLSFWAEDDPTIAETTLTDANTDSSGGRSTLRIQSANWAKPAVWVTTPPKPMTAAVFSSGMIESSAPCPKA